MTELADNGQIFMSCLKGYSNSANPSVQLGWAAKQFKMHNASNFHFLELFHAALFSSIHLPRQVLTTDTQNIPSYEVILMQNLIALYVSVFFFSNY